MINHILTAAKDSIRLTIFPLIILAACCGAIVFFQTKTDTPIGFFFRDANAIAGQPFFYGGMEYASSMFMMMSGAILLFCAGVENTAGKDIRRFLLLFGILTAMLGFDDLFMLHESMKILIHGFDELKVFAVYAVLLLVIFGLYHRILLQTPFFMFLFALFLLAIAAVEDHFEKPLFGIIMEDYLELVAFTFWAVYAVATAIMIRKGVIAGKRDIGAPQI